MLLSASCTSRRVSALMAACEGVVRVPSKLGRQRDRVGQRQAAAVQRDLAVGVAELGAQVAAVDLGQLEAGHVPHPEEERQRRLLSVVVEPPGDLEERLLEHVRVVDPARQAAAEPQVHHPLEPVAVGRE